MKQFSSRLNDGLMSRRYAEDVVTTTGADTDASAGLQTVRLGGEFPMTLSFLVATVAQLVTLTIVARVLLSWFPGLRALSPVTAAVTQATDPILVPIRRRLPAFGGFDLSPVIAIVLINVGESLLLGALAGQ